MTIPAGTLVPRDARDFGSYQLIAKIATGGMAEIFLARLNNREGMSSEDFLVLKRILPHLAEDEHFVTMFRDEAELASHLTHKNVCHVHAYGEFANTWFIAMEYLHGVPLSRMMTRLSKAGKMLDIRMVAGIVVQACEGLHAAHEAKGPDGQLMGVVHRDVSPPNIMVCDDGLVKVLDFGIAKARGANSRTRTGTVKGKNAYMSPEQILGKPLDRRSDVFALAIVMYEMLAIKRLFHRDSDFLTFKAITEEPIPDIRERRPDIPPGMRAALIQAMARDPNGRFDSAQAFGNAIRQSVATLGGVATPEELSKMLTGDFADEMASRDEILAAAKEPAPVSVPPRSGPAMHIVATPPPLPPAARSGEFSGRAKLATTQPTSPPVASMIVQQPGSTTNPFELQAPPLPPLPEGVIDLSAAVDEDSWMANPDTNLLRSTRWKSIVSVFVVLGLAAIVVVVVLLITRSPSTPEHEGSDVHSATPEHPDAAVSATTDAGNGMSKEDIKAISRFGYFSLKSNAKATIYIDSGDGFKYIGETPLERTPLPPGPKKIKAVGPKNKTKLFTTTILGGQDTDEGTISW
ncbi:MAG TPA: serine/threonine-protein kinase [Kofleriaceae bacterium]